MPTLPRELRAAFRSQTRKPGVTALAISSVALAIGFSTVAFSVLDAYALRRSLLPDSLVRILARTREQRFDDLTWIEFQALAGRARRFLDVLAECREGPRVRLKDRDDFPITAGISDNYFDVIGVRARMGDVFHRGQGEQGTVVVAHKDWKDALGGDPAIIGRTLAVGPAVLRVIGVLPPAFTGANRGLLVSLFIPPQTLFGRKVQDKTAARRLGQPIAMRQPEAMSPRLTLPLRDHPARSRCTSMRQTARPRPHCGRVIRMTWATAITNWLPGCGLEQRSRKHRKNATRSRGK